ncbi:MAG: hypothetical protein ACFFD8_06670, partial [Candidatus Thorarchaeota archaeon]
MASPKTVAIVPVRFIPSAKHRLANSMTASFRQQLVHAMLRDVIKGIKETTCINQVILVTRDTDFIADNLDGQYKLHQS